MTETTGKGILPENFGVARRSDTSQEGRAVVASCGGILDVVGAEGPEAVGVDDGAGKLVAGMVEVAHADLAGTLWTVVVTEHLVMAHISGAAAASGVTPVLLEIGLHRRCRCPDCPLESIPSFSPGGWNFGGGAKQGGARADRSVTRIKKCGWEGQEWEEKFAA